MSFPLQGMKDIKTSGDGDTTADARYLSAPVNEQPAPDHLRMSEVEDRLSRIEALAGRGKHTLDVRRTKVAPGIGQVLDVKRSLLPDLEWNVGGSAETVDGHQNIDRI